MSFNSHKSSSPYRPPGASRGLGYSTRGSYRGRGIDSFSSWEPSSMSEGRSYSGSSRGQFTWPKEYSSSRYTSGSSGSERYSSRGRGEDPGYRRYSRESSDYPSSRNHRDYRSPDYPRKRMRTEHGYVQASSSRRRHEGGNGSGPDYSNRYSYAEDRSRSYHSDRRSTSREEYSHQKVEAMENMPPPSSLPPRRVSSPRGPFRGGLSTRGVRGLSRMVLSKQTSTLLTRRNLVDSHAMRKRVLVAKAQADYLRKMTILKLKRFREAAASKAPEAKEGKVKEDSSKVMEDISDEEEEEDEKLGKGEEGELEEGETAEKEFPKKAKVEKNTKNEECEEGENIDDDAHEKKKEKNPETKLNGNVQITIKQDSDVRAVSEEESSVRRTHSGKPFIKLSCPHCFTECVTFQEYTMHLFSYQHLSAMRKQALRHKQTLADMRMLQRQKQRIVEEKEIIRGTLSARTKFCHICKLNYRQLKSKHMASEYHQEMVKFLLPICYICETEFKSPMLYENHRCSLDHIKRKAANAEKRMLEAEQLNENDGEHKDLDPDNFMVLDSVGDVDDNAEGGGKSKETREKDKKKKNECLGIEHVKTVEVYYCDLCGQYLPRSMNPERTLAIHCCTRSHLQRYIRYRDDELLRKEAERIHRKRLAKRNAAEETESKKASGEKNDEKMDEDKDESIDKDSPNKSEDSSGEKKNATSEVSQGADGSSEIVGVSHDDLDFDGVMDEKLWADVDKDLGDLLREVEPDNKSSDEDDDFHAEGGRYDRFRNSEKGSAAAKGDEMKTEDENAPEADREDDKEGKKLSESEVGDDKPVKTQPTPVAAAD